MTLREALYGLVGILMAYISWQLLRFLWLSLPRRKSARAKLDTELEGETALPEDGKTLAQSHSSFVGSFYEAPEAALVKDERPEPRLTRPLEPDASEFGFDALLEMRQLRHRFDEFQHQHEHLQTEVIALRDMVSDLRAATQVSPVYSEAVTLARRGYDAQVIADQCGISIAEAELVRSLTGDADEERDNE